MNHLTVETEDTFASFLDLAANNDVDGFKKAADHDASSVDEAGLWYGRKKGSKQMVLESRTPLMVAAMYGSIEVLKFILSLPEVDVNQSCGLDKSTALHCAASGGSVNAVDVVKMLLSAGADPNLTDANGQRPFDVIVVAPKFQELKVSLEKLLATDAAVGEHNLRVSTATSNSNSPPLSPSPGNGSPLSDSDSTSSPKINDIPASSAPEKREYPVDPSLPDIKNSIYATDEFRMFSFKVRPCSRAYSHDWTECPFVHPGENARRRDPRKYHYSCVPCPDFRKGACRRGDMCEYAHGVFECWLHPAQYRTRLCKDGTSCNRRVCFFAHTHEELRPLFVSTGSGVASPRSGTSNASAMDYAAAMSFFPGSPSSVSVMSPSPFTPPMSPSSGNISNMGWAQQNVPALHLPGSNLQSSRLRSSLNARDIPTEELNMLSDIEVQKEQELLDEISRLTLTNIKSNSSSRSARSKTLTPSNLEDLFTVESSSPRYSDQALAAGVFSPTHKSARLNQFQQQQGILSSINTNFPPKNVDHPLLQASFGVPSSGRMSPRSMEPISPMSSRIPMLAQREKQQQFRSLSSRDLGSSSSALIGSSMENWSNWGSSSGIDWAMSSDFGRLKRSSSFENANNMEEPDLSWVQTLVRDSTGDGNETKEFVARYNSTPAAVAAASSADGKKLNDQVDQLDQFDQTALTALLDQMQIDHLVTQ